MNMWQLTSFFPVYLLGSIMSFFLAVVGWRMRNVKGATYFSLLNLGVGIWSLGYLLGFFNTDLNWKLFMLRIEYFGDVSSILLWLMFAISYTHNTQWLTKRNIVLLAIVPFMTFIEILFVKQHHFFYSSYGLATEGGLVRFVKEYNIGFYIWALYAYSLTLFGCIILIRGIFHNPRIYRKQIIPLATSVILLLIPNFLYVTGKNPVAPYDPTTLSFTVVSVIFLILLKRYHLFDLVPVAHHMVFKNVKSGVIIIDKKNRILEMNDAAEKIIGRVQDTVLGQSITMIIPELEEFVSDFIDEEIKVELQIGNENRIFEIQFTPLIESGNIRSGIIIMFYDITDLKNIQNELDTFSRTVAHDLKNPLSAQVNYIELLKLDYLTDEDRNTSYDMISRSAEKMIGIVDALLLLAKVRNMESVLIDQVNMDAIVNSVLVRMNIGFSDTKVKIIQPQSWPVAMGYAPWIEEIWANYIGNAIKYGGKPPVVELGVDQQQGYLRFWVKDNGDGLSEEEQASLFQDFSRLEKHASGHEGHGLGLSIVRRIADKLGGEVGVVSDGRNGCTFFFTLPEKS